MKLRNLSFAFWLAYCTLVEGTIITDVGLCKDVGITVTQQLYNKKIGGIYWITDKVVYAGTTDFSFYRSSDGGKTWTNQDTLLRNSKVSINPNPINPSTMMVLGTFPDFSFWTSNDAGATYQYHSQYSNYSGDFAIMSVKYHPKEPKWAVAGGWSKACFYTVPGGSCVWSYYITKDFGTTWTFLDSFVNQFEWGSSEGGKAEFFYTASSKKSGSQYDIKRWELNVGDMANLENVMGIYDNVTYLFDAPSNNSVLFFEKVSDEGVALYISENLGLTWNQATFPSTEPQYSYTILEDAAGAVMVNVQHGNNNYGNIYVSDEFGGRFTLSLRNNRKMKSSGEWDEYFVDDFLKMADPIKGVYIANSYTDQSGPISPTTPLKTSITMNMGSTWSPLKAPEKDADGNPIVCEDGCSLHLLGMLEKLWVHPGFYSSPGAIGIALGSGNVGQYLTDKVDEMKTFMTRDAGNTWTEIIDGLYSYEIGDLGSLILFAELQNATNSLLFTWNEGLNFSRCQFTTSGKYEVGDIVVGRDWTGEKFILYGGTDSSGITVHLDFSDYHVETCESPELAGTPASDYEWWSPFDMKSGTCHLGRNTTYVRRKQDAPCFNPENYQPLVSEVQCPCVLDDYDCDYCYEWVEGKCQIACPDWDPKLVVPSPCNDYYYVSQGYRRVVGDTCDVASGLDLMPVKTACPSSSTTGGSSPPPGSKKTGGILILFVVFVCLLAAAFLGTFRFVKKYHKPAFLYKLLNEHAPHKDSTTKGAYAPLSIEE